MKTPHLQLLTFFVGVTSGLQAVPTSEIGEKPDTLGTMPEGLAASDWQSIREAYEAGRHAFHPSATGWHADNPGQEWGLEFDLYGFVNRPNEGGWSWGLELQSYGFGQSEVTLSDQPIAKAAGQRLGVQRDAVLEEWFINDERGLKHGFTIDRCPDFAEPRSTDVLDVTLKTRGTLYPVIDRAGQRVVFRNDAHVDVVTYTGLKVWDADGRILPSHFAEAASERSFRLVVDSRGARYPITIDPIAQRAYLKPAAVDLAPPPDQFGYSVAVYKNTVVVGAPGEDSSSTGVNSTPMVTENRQVDSGAAYIFTLRGTRWVQEAYLKPNAFGDSQDGDRFGHSVAISNGTVVIGAPYEDSGTTGVNTAPGDDASGQESGAAYVYTFDSSTAAWVQQAYLKPESFGLSQQGDGFGWSVAIAGETLAIGAPFEDSSTTGVNSIPNEEASNSGATYVFVRDAGDWSQEAYVKPEAVGTSQAGDLFGWSVGIWYNGLVVGAPFEDSVTTGISGVLEDSNGPDVDSGAAYVFARSGTTWSQQATLKPDGVGTTQAGDRFGYSVAAAWSLVNAYIIVGAPLEDGNGTGVNSVPDEAGEDSGAAYVFILKGGTWTQQAYLKPQTIGQTQEGDHFGHAVGISPDYAVVGAPFEDSSGTGIDSTPDENSTDAGAAYIFARSSQTWTQEVFVKPQMVGLTQAEDHYGFSVAISNSVIGIGSPNEDSDTVGVDSMPDEAAPNVGAAHALVFGEDTWSQQAFLKAAGFGYPGELDYFGWSVAVSGDTVVVGAYQEDSSSLGINSVPNNEATEAGAAYVFVKNGEHWTQQAYLKPEAVGTSQAFDEFGHSVAISEDTIVIGAHYESSSSTGINGTPNENAIGSGAAYVFVRNEGVWSQEAYLKPAAVGETQEFDQFGYSVAVSGDTVVVGALREDSATIGINQAPDEMATNAGAAYVFVRKDREWSQEAYLKPMAVGSTQLGDQFGTSVSVSGDTVVVGAPWECSSTTGSNTEPNEDASFAGAVYVFVRNEGIWNQQAYLKSDNGDAMRVGDQFGWSVSLVDNVLLVGAPGEDSASRGINSGSDENASEAGAAFVFERREELWSQQAYLKPGTLGQTQAQDRFGCSVAVSGNMAVVGARAKNDSATGVNAPPQDGSSIQATSAGAAYVFIYSEGRWSQRAYLKPDEVGSSQEFDLFGSSVAVSEDTVVVGAHGESSSTCGVNSLPDEDVYSAGAAYIYEGFGSTLSPIQTWRQTNFSDIENAGTAANPMDFDGDGWANLVEYGVATDPAEQGGNGVTLGLSSDGQFLEASFRRDPSRVDVTINVQTAESPSGPWTTVATSVDGTAMIGPGLESETALAGGLILVNVRDTVPISAADTLRRFLRVVVE